MLTFMRSNKTTSTQIQDFKSTCHHTLGGNTEAWSSNEMTHYKYNGITAVIVKGSITD